MSSVTQRVSQIKQPYGGYLRPRDFECIVLNDDNVLSEQENIHPSLVGMAVDYLSTPHERPSQLRMKIKSVQKAKDLLN